MYACRAQGKTLGIQGILTGSTALFELPYLLKVLEFVQQAHIHPDLQAFYLDWEHYPTLRKGRQNKHTFTNIKARWEEFGLPSDSLQNFDENIGQLPGLFWRAVSGQSAELEKARYPRHPLARQLKRWAHHYARQTSPYYASLSGRDRGIKSLTGEFKTQIITDVAYRRSFTIVAAEQMRRLIGDGTWGYALFVTTERSPIELAQYNAAVPFLSTPGAKKDTVRLPIVNLDVTTKLD